jgi:hypothetical protein
MMWVDLMGQRQPDIHIREKECTRRHLPRPVAATPASSTGSPET